jgi:hypothetical protein
MRNITFAFSLLIVLASISTAFANINALRDVAEAYNAKNFCHYVQPSDPAVQAKLQEILAVQLTWPTGFWGDVQKIVAWMQRNIKYVSGDWQTPSDTLCLGGGDCKNQATLLASLLLAYNPYLPVYCIVIHPQTFLPQDGHVASLILLDGEVCVLDTAGCYFTMDNAITSQPVATEINNWLANWKSDMPNVKVTCTFNNREAVSFSGTNEFLKWTEDQK